MAQRCCGPLSLSPRLRTRSLLAQSARPLYPTPAAAMSDYSDCDEPGAIGIVEAVSRMQISSSHSDDLSRLSGAQPGESPLRDVSNRRNCSGHSNNSSSKFQAHLKPSCASAIDLCSPPESQSRREQEPDQENLAATPSHAPASSTAAPACSSSAVAVPAAPASSSPFAVSAPSSIASSSSAVPAPAGVPSSKKLGPSSFNHYVREAKAAEERGDLQRALEIYRDALAPMRPELDTIPKKVRILTKRIKKQQRSSRVQEEEEAEEQEQSEQADEAAAPQAAASSSTSSSAVAEPRMLSMVLDGKFAFDAAHSRYTLLCSADPACASASEVGAMASSAGSVSSNSPLLSPYSLPASIFDRIYPYQQEGIHWLYNHIHCSPAPNVSAGSSSAAATAGSTAGSGGCGGILGDDMGLGKTVSTAVFLSGLFSNGLIRRALVIVPISVLEHWRAEILRWCGAVDDEGEIAAAKGKGSKPCTAAEKKPSAAGLRLLSVYVGKRTPKQRAASELALTQLLASPSSKAIVLTTYGQFGTKPEIFSSPHGASASARYSCTWDYIVADEAHKLKNPETQLHQKLHALASNETSHRLLLTGTPIMNDLDELWALMDLACSGNVFGSRKQFKIDFATRILAGLAKCATPAEKDLGAQLTRKLKERMGPYMLRREKAQVKHQMNEGEHKSEEKAAEDHSERDAQANPAAVSSIPRSLCDPSVPSNSAPSALSILPRLSTQKNDLIIWLHLSSLQEELYRKFLSNDSVKSVFTLKSRGPLPALTALKKLCDHPRMIDPGMAYMETIAGDLENLQQLPGVQIPRAVAAAVAAGASGGAAAPSSSSSGSSSNSRTKEIPQATAQALAEPGRPQLATAVRMLCSESAKYSCLESLLKMHVASGHRTLIFSQSLRMLGFITLLLAHLQMKYLRIDGTVNDPAERQRRVDQFNRDKTFHAFLLTTRAGAVGLNLTGASRVVIFDPDWTPSLDNQAVDRAYRIGQVRNVVVYRFITCGTVEEVIYRKQVFKGSIIRAATGVKQQQTQADGAAAANAPVRAGSDPSSAAVTDDSPTRYFGKDELREVFHFTSSTTSSAFDSLRRLHPPELQRKSYPELDEHTKAIEAIPGVHGITDHDLMFSETAVKPEDMAAQEAAAVAAAQATAASAANAAISLAAESGDLDASMLADLSAQLPLAPPPPAAASHLERAEDIAAIVAAATARLEATIGAPRTPPRAKRTKTQLKRERRDGDQAEESKEAQEDEAADASSCDDPQSTSSTPSQTGTLPQCDDGLVRGSPMESPPGGVPMHEDAEEDDGGSAEDHGAEVAVAIAPLLDDSVIDLTGADEGVQAAFDRMLVEAEAEEKAEDHAEERAEESAVEVLDDSSVVDADAGAMTIPMALQSEPEAAADAVDPDATLPYKKPELEAPSESESAAVLPALQPLLPLDGEEKEREPDVEFVWVSPESPAPKPEASGSMDSTLPYDAPAPPESLAESLEPAAMTDAPAVAQSNSDTSDCTLPFHPPSPGFLGGGGADRPSVVFDLSLSGVRSSFASPGTAAAMLPPSSPPRVEHAVPVLSALAPASLALGVAADVAPVRAAPAVRAPSIVAARGHVILQLDDSSDDEQDDEHDDDDEEQQDADHQHGDDDEKKHAETEAPPFENVDAQQREENSEEAGLDAVASPTETPVAATYTDLLHRASQFHASSPEGRLLQLECLLHAFMIDKSDPALQLRIFELATETGLVSLLPVA